MSILLMFIIKLLYVLSIFSDGKSDAIIDNTGKRSHFWELLSIACLGIVILLTWHFYYAITLVTLLMYLPLRMGLFNLVLNKYRGLPYYYVGTTDKFYDKWIKWMSDIESQPRKYKVPILSIWYFLIFWTAFFLY